MHLHWMVHVHQINDIGYSDSIVVDLWGNKLLHCFYRKYECSKQDRVIKDEL